MLQYKFETEPVKQILEAMSKKIDQFGSQDMPAGLIHWQTEDMHRQFPNIEILDSKTALTRVWPTSRFSLMKQRYHVVKVARSWRPILRKELFDTLCQRMYVLMEEKIKWR